MTVREFWTSTVALNVSYQEAPTVAWVDARGHWQNRRRNETFRSIGRIYWVSPTQVELYCLRMLLCHVKGAASYEELRTTARFAPGGAACDVSRRVPCYGIARRR